MQIKFKKGKLKISFLALYILTQKRSKSRYFTSDVKIRTGHKKMGNGLHQLRRICNSLQPYARAVKVAHGPMRKMMLLPNKKLNK